MAEWRIHSKVLCRMNYNILTPWKTLDPWQKKYIETEGNCFLLCSRQSGKTAAMSIKFGKRAAENKNRTVGMFAFTEKQAYNLFFKTLMYLRAIYPRMIKGGADKPTKHVINLTNGSQIMCYAVGLHGEGIRTYTLTDLAIDEAAPMAREVFVALFPMLSITKGSWDLSSTPRGKKGFFYECSDDDSLGDKIKDNITRFYVSYEDCPRHDEKFLEEARKNMTELEFAQEYQARFLDELRQLMSDELIKKVMVLPKPEGVSCFSTSQISGGDPFLGVDVARMGKDKIVLLSLSRIQRKKLKMFGMIIKEKQLLTETARQILNIDLEFKYRKIYIDTTGQGWGVFDILFENKQTKRKVVSIENIRRFIDNEDKTKKVMKEELYKNLIILMEQGKIELFNDKRIAHSLASVQYDADGKKIIASDGHIAEALGRAAWCIKDKSLKPFIHSRTYGA